MSLTPDDLVDAWDDSDPEGESDAHLEVNVNGVKFNAQGKYAFWLALVVLGLAFAEYQLL